MSTMNLSANCWSAPSRNRSLKAAVGTCILMAFPGCKIPQLCSPAPFRQLPEAYDKNNDPSQGIVGSENSAQLGWAQFFNDPALNSLIAESLQGNQELKILAQEIRIANNEILARRGSLFPFVSLGTRAGIEKSSRFTRNGAVEESLEAAPGKGFPEPLPDFLVAADVSWEIDIWRKLRNARDAATLRYLGTKSGRNYVVTRLVSELAENYYELLALDNQLLTLQRTIEIQTKSLETAKALKDAARGTELAVQRFQAEVQKNQSLILLIQQQIVEAENRINFIAGRFPQPVERPSVEFLDLSLNALNVGIPSQQLLFRADIQQAEREVAAAGLDVRVARAQFFPSLVLTAGVGYQAFNTKYLFSSPESLIYGAAGGLVGPLINRAAIKADYMNANARQLQAIYDYQQTVLTAHIEVVNHLSTVENFGKSIEVKRRQLEALEASVDNATKLFQNARGEYIDVLLSQRDLMEARMDLIETKQKQLAAVISAYQALGGGGYAGAFLIDDVEYLDLIPQEEAIEQELQEAMGTPSGDPTTPPPSQLDKPVEVISGATTALPLPAGKSIRWIA
jgi:NodT family efflux transporter outer membrane factor (OMF) lipoprotein